jgi:hypothetical protein
MTSIAVVLIERSKEGGSMSVQTGPISYNVTQRGSIRSRSAAAVSIATMRQVSAALPPERAWGLWASRMYPGFATQYLRQMRDYRFEDYEAHARSNQGTAIARHVSVNSPA